MKTIAIIAAALSLASAASADAQYGRLVPADKLVALHGTACRASAPDFETKVAIEARRQKWDEYGVSAKAKPGDRAWLVAIGGQPSIVDISRAGRTQRCSVNAVSAPAAVLALVTKAQGRKPDGVRSQGPNGTVSIWRVSPGRTLSVTVPIGQALSRITLEASR
jgi:hypothetical protein